MAFVWGAQNNVEPIDAYTIAAIANMANYAISSGCASSYSGVNMDVTSAAGVEIYNGVAVVSAGGSVTLTSDPTNPRWIWRYLDATGTQSKVTGSAGAIPAVPALGSNTGIGLDYVNAGQTIANNCTYKLDKRVIFPTSTVTKYKAATQVFTTSTTFVDVTASSGLFAFPIGAGEVWRVEYYIPLAFGGTGGARFQLTGPAAATSVIIWADAVVYLAASANNYTISPQPLVTAFSSTIAGFDSAASTDGRWGNAASETSLRATALIQNGVNAGTVTLQAGQNSSNSTTTLGLGASMVAKRMV